MDTVCDNADIQLISVGATVRLTINRKPQTCTITPSGYRCNGQYISIDTPLAQALLNHNAGESFTIMIDGRRSRVKVESVEFGHQSYIGVL